MQTFTELKANVATLTQRSSSAVHITAIGVWINLELEHLYNIYDYWHELKATHNFTTVDGTALYYMPSDFGLSFRFYDITNDKKIAIKTEEEYFDSNIANIADANEADADTAYFKEVVGVKVQVDTAGDTVQAKSSSASDTAVTVRVEGYIDSGLTTLGFENIVVTGTTAVAGSTTFYKITHVSKNKDSVGYITLEDSSADDLAILQDIDRVLSHKAFRLGRIPDDSSTSMRVLYKKKFRKLVNDNDYPFVDADGYLIFAAAATSLFQQKEPTERVKEYERKASEALNALLSQHSGSLGPDYQQKMTNVFATAHRTRR